MFNFKYIKKTVLQPQKNAINHGPIDLRFFELPDAQELVQITSGKSTPGFLVLDSKTCKWVESASKCSNIKSRINDIIKSAYFRFGFTVPQDFFNTSYIPPKDVVWRIHNTIPLFLNQTKTIFPKDQYPRYVSHTWFFIKSIEFHSKYYTGFSYKGSNYIVAVYSFSFPSIYPLPAKYERGGYSLIYLYSVEKGEIIDFAFISVNAHEFGRTSTIGALTGTAD